MEIKQRILRFYILLIQFGIDPRSTLLSFRGLPRYLRDLWMFRANYTGLIELRPCLHDWYEEGGTTKDEYFWQDLLVARMIFADSPKKHVDIGSRVDGFVAHVAGFREIEVFDVRPITTQIPGILFKQADLMNPIADMQEYCDSLSCLHALEHFGLGRYGDPLDPSGFEHGVANMASLLKQDGLFYLSVPIGIERVEFNANRVFDPHTIIHSGNQNSLKLIELIAIKLGGQVEKIALDDENINSLASERYALGIFVFQKSIQP
jgi:SAM-dependent methyltransferase